MEMMEGLQEGQEGSTGAQSMSVTCSNTGKRWDQICARSSLAYPNGVIAACSISSHRWLNVQMGGNIK